MRPLWSGHRTGWDDARARCVQVRQLGALLAARTDVFHNPYVFKLDANLSYLLRFRLSLHLKILRNYPHEVVRYALLDDLGL